MHGTSSDTKLQLDYKNKVVLAPMVRVNTMPMRVLALEYGADLVYSEELIALKLMKCSRVYNNDLNTIDFVDKGNLVYRTNQLSKHKNIVQIGAADSVTALNAATVVAGDIAGIDLNCGCPIHFSTQGEMGAALLKKPDTIVDIISTLERNLSIPVSLKVRLLEKESDSVELLRRAEHAGASAVAVHSRYVHERPHQKAHWDILGNVIKSSALSIPVIANGDVLSREDIQSLKTISGADSVMVARGAIANPSIFALYGHGVPRDVAVRRYVEHAVSLDNCLNNTKYVVKLMLETSKNPLFNEVQNAHSMTDICNIWGISHKNVFGNGEPQSR